MRGARHSKLREATASRHDALDAHVVGAGYFQTRAGYAQYLQRLHAFHAIFDLQARRLAPDLFGRWHVDQHAGLLTRDLEALGCHAAMPAAPATDAFCLSDRSAVIGALYVVIGSSLGARVLLPWANKLPLPGGGGAGVSYLSHLAASRDWPAFVAFLDDDDTIDEPAMLRGAEAAFDAVHLFLAERLTA